MKYNVRSLVCKSKLFLCRFCARKHSFFRLSSLWACGAGNGKIINAEGYQCGFCEFFFCVFVSFLSLIHFDLRMWKCPRCHSDEMEYNVQFVIPMSHTELEKRVKGNHTLDSRLTGIFPIKSALALFLYRRLTTHRLMNLDFYLAVFIFADMCELTMTSSMRLSFQCHVYIFHTLQGCEGRKIDRWQMLNKGEEE